MQATALQDREQRPMRSNRGALERQGWLAKSMEARLGMQLTRILQNGYQRLSTLQHDEVKAADFGVLGMDGMGPSSIRYRFSSHLPRPLTLPTYSTSIRPTDRAHYMRPRYTSPELRPLNAEYSVPSILSLPLLDRTWSMTQR